MQDNKDLPQNREPPIAMNPPFQHPKTRSPTYLASCRNCGADLKTHRERQEEFCSNIRCRPACMAYLRQKAKEHEQQQMEMRDAQALKTLSDVRANWHSSVPIDNDVVLMIVPNNTRQLVSQSEENIAEFRAYLENIMQLAEEQITDSASHEFIQIEHESRAVQQQTSLPVINACSTCRGACCLQAKGHAFLNKDFFAWRLLNEHDTSGAEMIDQYISQIPDQAYEDSCVYHGPQGCVLPREIRSSTCNRFLCTEIHDGQRRNQNQKTVSSIAIVDSDGVMRVGLSTAEGDRTETTFQQHTSS